DDVRARTRPQVDEIESLDELDELDDGAGHFNFERARREANGQPTEALVDEVEDVVDPNSGIRRYDIDEHTSGVTFPPRKPASVFGDPGERRPWPEVDDELRAINRRDDYPQGLPHDRRLNCTHCAVATDNVLAGRPASALPAWRDKAGAVT